MPRLAATLSTTADGAVHTDGVCGVDDFVLAVAELFGRQIGFVFKGYQHVAEFALHEGGGGGAAAAFEHFDVGEHFFQVGAGLGRACRRCF